MGARADADCNMSAEKTVRRWAVKLMSTVIIAIAIFWSLAQVVFAQPFPAPDGAWLQNGIKWSKAPRTINAKLRSGSTAILYFRTDHAFSLMYATVLRVPKEYEVICNGCGQVVHLGTWQIDEKQSE